MISPSAVFTSSEGTTLIGRSGILESANAFARPLWSVTQSAPRPRSAATWTSLRGSFSESLLSRVWQCMSTFIVSPKSKVQSHSPRSNFGLWTLDCFEHISLKLYHMLECREKPRSVGCKCSE